MGVRLKRVPEEDHKIDPSFRDGSSDLLIAAERPAQEAADRQPELACKKRPRRPGRVELVLR
jgi:hypothetical protein